MSYSEEARRKANHQVGDLYLKAVAHGHIVDHKSIAIDLQCRVNELEEALRGVLPYMEEAERAGLVGDEGCHWPVEIVRAALLNNSSLILPSSSEVAAK